ncbi:MAG TPA: GcrA family cell cycle regulator [Xanthobacteraceae bacterium]|jgi:GcrA cell cycle regulator|nr:GcrA family cell cycle regulator [Xanthobacteraceae bacterium]
MRGIWTRRRIALLKRLWTDGKTAPAIAAQLRMSKSAVLGKVFRLRLGPAGNATKASARSNTKILNRRHKRRPPVKRRAKPAAPAMASGKTLFELTNDSCRWPHGQPGTEAFHFCGAAGADLEGGRPYCDLHARRAYVGRSKTAATAARAGAAVPPITSPSIVPSGVKRLVFSQGRKRS